MYKKIPYKLIGLTTLLTIIIFSVFIASGSKVEAQSFTPITHQLDLGDRGIDVTNLQTFFAADPSIYPQGLITGYFGTLTRSAVMSYQASNGISPAGRVGPITLAKINEQISTGNWPSDIYSPLFSNVSKSAGRDKITFTFNTNEATTAYVVYSTSALSFNEGDINSVGFAVLNGTRSDDLSGSNTYHTINVTGLNPNTSYYYTLVAKDAKGNISVWGVNNKFTTIQ